MVVYVVGDLQGCLDFLKCLLECVVFDLVKDCLWLVGDLVNCGLQFLEMLCFFYVMCELVVSVLGNYDLYLLVVVYKFECLKKFDMLWEIFEVLDCELLFDWLCCLLLLYYDE